MRDSERPVRCAQCGWTIAPERVQVVILGDGNTVYFHKGGCPRPKPLNEG